jgi:enamine deaminase RidA (YjgF/YER057c/UK114 family)
VPENSDGSVPEGFEAQCEQAWRNVIEVLAAAGLGVEHLVKINTFPDRPKPGRGQPRHSPQDARRERTRVHGDDRETVDGKWLLEIEAIAAE